MTREEQAIEYIKNYREIDEKLYNTVPKGTVASIAIKKCLEFWDMAIQALSQVSEIEENIIKYMKKYPNHVGNMDFWEGFYACRNVVLQLDDEGYAPKEQEPCEDCRNCKKWDDCECGRKGHINGTSIGYSIGECKDYEPCDDAISREELLKAIDTWDKFGYTETGCFVREPKGDYVPYIHYDDVIKCIKGMPPVTPSRRKGHWLKTGQSFLNPNKFRNFCCTECLHELEEHIRKEPKYCPNCGAKMESEDKE